MTAKNCTLTQAKLKEILHYDYNTGVFTWKIRSSNSIQIGDTADNCHSYGYKRIGINGRRYLAHRLAWLYVYGDWPEIETDHINGIRDDNRLINLREVTRKENNKNLGIRNDNTSDCTGVSWFKSRQKWRAYITLDGVQKHLGLFRDINNAIKTRKLAEKKYGFHPNHGRPSLDTQYTNRQIHR